MKNQVKLMQLLQNNQQKEKKALRVENQDDSATIYLYGVIDDYFGISGEEVARALEDLKDKEVKLRINSPGGDVFVARSMYAAIKLHGNVTAQIDSVAVSAATFVAMAAKEVTMIDGGFMMIHNAWTFGFGNKNDFIELADLLGKFDESIIKDYIKKTGKSQDEIAVMMDAETWMNAEESKEMGFIDSIFDGEEAGEGGTNNKWNLSAFDNVPQALAAPGPDPQEEAWQRQRAMAERRLRILNAVTH